MSCDYSDVLTKVCFEHSVARKQSLLVYRLNRAEPTSLQESATSTASSGSRTTASSSSSSLANQYVLDRKVEDFLQTLLGERRTFHVFNSFDLSGQLLALCGADGGQALLFQALEELRVVTQIDFGSDKNIVSGAVMGHLGPPLSLHVLERRL